MNALTQSISVRGKVYGHFPALMGITEKTMKWVWSPFLPSFRVLHTWTWLVLPLG